MDRHVLMAMCEANVTCYIGRYQCRRQGGTDTRGDCRAPPAARHLTRKNPRSPSNGDDRGPFRWRLQTSLVRNRTCVRSRLQTLPLPDGSGAGALYQRLRLCPATSQLARCVEHATRGFPLASQEKAPFENSPFLERSTKMRHRVA